MAPNSWVEGTADMLNASGIEGHTMSKIEPVAIAAILRASGAM
jgi:hypothetical protein